MKNMKNFSNFHSHSLHRGEVFGYGFTRHVAVYGMAAMMSMVLLVACNDPVNPGNPDNPDIPEPNEPVNTGEWVYVDGMLDYEIHEIIHEQSGNGGYYHSDNTYKVKSPLTLGIYYFWFNKNRTQDWLDARKLGGISVIYDAIGNGSNIRRPDDEKIAYTEWSMQTMWDDSKKIPIELSYLDNGNSLSVYESVYRNWRTRCTWNSPMGTATTLREAHVTLWQVFKGPDLKAGQYSYKMDFGQSVTHLGPNFYKTTSTCTTWYDGTDPTTTTTTTDEGLGLIIPEYNFLFGGVNAIENGERNPAYGIDLDKALMDKFMQDPSTPVIIPFEATDGNGLSIRGTFALNNGQLPEVEAVIEEPAGYERWLPEAGANENVKGNDIKVKVHIQRRGEEGKAPPQTCKFRYELLPDVSRELGVCNNFPATGMGATTEDLQFRQLDNPQLQVKSAVFAESEEGLHSSEIAINSYDWGAYGKLMVTAILDDGTEIIAEYKKRGERFLRIPKDDDDSHIADYWEEDYGVYGRGANWDEDPIPANQRRAGDGYTNYEEYRGFRTLTADHVRTDPTEKDLFVVDEKGYFKQYYEPYNPANLTNRYIDRSMMQGLAGGTPQEPGYRVVNFNSVTHKYADQYCMVIEEGYPADETPDFTIYGQVQGGKYDYSSFEHPMKTYWAVWVNPRHLHESSAKVQSFYTTIVIHEIGHHLGITHHLLREDVSGQPVSMVEDITSAVQGVPNCAMRYYTQMEWTLDWLDTRTRYCRATDPNWTDSTTGFEYPPDDCFGQIDVKSD